MPRTKSTVFHDELGLRGLVSDLGTGADQSLVIDFLSSPKTYEDDTSHVEVITTHGAKVFVGNREVYKIKQAVKYDYMNFSSLERREAVCKRELEINRPFAPSVYRDVVAITRNSHGELAINGEGDVVEWAVHMNRFCEEDVLERIAERRELSNAMSALLGKQIANYHQDLAKAETSDGALRIQEIINELINAFGDRDLDVPVDLVTEFKIKVIASFEAELAHLDARAAYGLVRRCHGDLHLRNIVMIDDIPTPFDALEFDERLATTDVLYDLAFLLMDMLHRRLNRQANVAFNRYVHASWSLSENYGFQVLPIFLAIRAAIRAMVCAQTALRDPSSALELRNESRNYLFESLSFMEPNEPKLVAIGGLSGTGKSTLSADLAPDLGRLPGSLLLRSDLERKKIFDAPEFERLPVESYSQTASRHVYESLFDKARVALQQGQTVVLDAVFAKSEDRRKVAEIAHQLSIPFCGLWLDAPASVLIERVAGRRKDASDADIEVVKKQLASQRSVNRPAIEGWDSVDASGSVEDTRRNAELIVEHAFNECRCNPLTPSHAA